MPRPLKPRPLTIALLACASLAISAPATVDRSDTGETGLAAN
jgi:hypothetical protein